jgi:hypothetical protein
MIMASILFKVMELSFMDANSDKSPSHTPSGISRGDLKAVAAIEVCQARDKCRIKKVEYHSGDTRGGSHIVSARAAEMNAYAPLAHAHVCTECYPTKALSSGVVRSRLFVWRGGEVAMYEGRHGPW